MEIRGITLATLSRLRFGRGGQDWSLKGSRMGIVFGPKMYRLETSNESVKARLINTGLVETMRTWPPRPELTYRAQTGVPNVIYDADKGHLKYDVNVRPNNFDQLTAEQFVAQLDLLFDLAKINKEADSYSGVRER